MKYEPLGDYLAGLPASQSEVSLRFTEIEKILGAKLPPSASTYRQWWENQEGGSRAPHWRAAGFAVDSVDLRRKMVRFRRNAALPLRTEESAEDRQIPLEKELEQALRDINARAGAEEGLGSGRFTILINNRTGLGAARHSLKRRSDGATHPGFDTIMAVGRPDLTLEYVVLQERFQRLFEPEELAEARRRLGWLQTPKLEEIVAAIESQAQGHLFGRLHEIRRKLFGLSRASRTIFKSKSTFEDYAFHWGGRTELQFNVGFEYLDDGEQYLRHGVAISLQRNATFHDIDDAMLDRIERFNAYVRRHEVELDAFRMYHADDHDETGNWSGDYPVREIAPEIAKVGMFIFLGRRQRPAGVSVELILRDFDQLLPFYEFVEGGGDLERPATVQADDAFVAGLMRKPSSTAVRLAERRLNRKLRHNDIQYALGKYLANEHGKDFVRAEYVTRHCTKVDLAVKHGEALTFYEIKVAWDAKECIRQAIGQLLEYSFWPGAREAKELIIVGEAPLDNDAKTYLNLLRERFALPLAYRCFNMDKGKFAN